MALVSAQRVEYVAGQLVAHLLEFDQEVYGITGKEFMAETKKANLARATLGKIFKLHKLNHLLALSAEFDDYLNKRNQFVHSFWKDYLNSTSVEQVKKAIDFCYDFGKHSERLESFFKGFTFFLALRNVKDRSEVKEPLKQWEKDFDYFLSSLQKERLLNNYINIEE